MHLARLDNEVFFKKAFTDPVVFRAFVRDIVGIETNPPVIETEKSFSPKAGNVAFRYDIFADDPESRTIVEIQKVEYDHNFDRFLHYHIQGITEQQRSSEDYGVARTVYTIVVMTAPYRVSLRTGEIYRDEVMVSNMNPCNLLGRERPLFNHKLVFLNPNYRGEGTPANYRDWLDLIFESIHHPENPRINTGNAGVARAASLVEFDSLSPEDLERSKIEVGKRKVLKYTYDEGMEEGMEKGIEKGKDEAIDMGIVGLIRQGILTDGQIAAAFGVTVERVRELRKREGEH